MSALIPPVNQDDDGPEEGEIEDDEDDIIFLDRSSPSSPHRSSTTTSTSLDIHASPTPAPARKDCYERDIRHFEFRRGRTTRRRPSGGSKSPYSVASSTRNKSKHSRTGLTQGKENRHIHRYKSPVHVHRHRRGSNDRTLIDFKEISPVRRDSSCSSVESDERSTGRSTHYRSTRKCPSSSRIDRSKRKSSSSPESAYIPPKRRAHHSEKCPLMKVLHSVAKETRLIALENSENHTESSSLRQRLLNMGAMPGAYEEVPSSSKDNNLGNLEAGIDVAFDSRPSSKNSTKKEDASMQVQTESTQTEESDSKTHKLIKQEPEIVVLTDSEEMVSNELKETMKNGVTPYANSTIDQPEFTSDHKPSEQAETAKSISLATSECDDDVEEDDDDIGRLRLLALQSKKHEPTPLEDADVLQLRLAALKTAFMKKFKTRKQITIKINSKPSKEDPLSPLDEIPMPFSPASPDEVMTPVDMELAETDDEAASVHSISRYSPSDPIPECYSPSDPVPEHYSPCDPYPECYSPSNPTGSPTVEMSLQDLLPPPPPPDLDLFFPDQNFETPFHGAAVEDAWRAPNLNYEPVLDIAAPPPLPPYFRDLLSEDAEYPNSAFTAANEAVANFEEEESPASCNEPPGVISHVDTPPECVGPTIPSVSSLLENLLDNTSEEIRDPEPIPILIGAKHSTPAVTEKSDVTEKSGVTEVKKTETPVLIPCQPKLSLEEEEKALRKRLLLNLANNRERLLKLNCDKKESLSVSGKIQEPKIVSNKHSKVELPGVTGAGAKKLPTVTTESAAGNLRSSLSSPAPNPPVDKRLIINLGDDSDSCEDYSEAEALGHKCSKNKEKWSLYLKELEVNPPKKMSPGIKLAAVNGKVTQGNAMKVKQAPRDKSVKKPFAENLADLESSVERFLKGVRNSHEAISKTSLGSATVSSNVTPVAVRHLPASQQEEYRRLKQQIAKLEKQRQMSIELQKRGLQSISKGTQLSLSANMANLKQAAKIPSQVVPSSSNSSKSLLDTPKRDLKSLNGVSLSAQSSKQTGRDASHKPLKVAPSQSSLKSFDSNVTMGVPVNHSTSALANVSNLTVTSLTNAKKHTIQCQQPKLLKVNNTQETNNMQNRQKLLTLQASLVTERSHVLGELSALAKLLSQVEYSLEAQSHTATEVSSLIDKLSIAVGRWKAQNRTATGLVQRVAQRQRELSLRHRQCVAASKSCAQLGSQLIGKNYRVPLDKADAMRLQLKQVHEKTQILANRKSVEQARRNVLEKRAEHCLMKLFSDSNTSKTNGNNSKQEQTAVLSSTTKALEKDKLKPILAPNLQTTKVLLGSSSEPPASSRIQLSSSSSAAAAAAAASSLDAHEKKNKVAVQDSTQISASLMSRAVSYRLALNRVRYAKAVLNLANKKRTNQKKLKATSKSFGSKKQLADKNYRQDLSDMDISTDGEEAEKRSKNLGANTDEVDMSVSPDTSPSSSGVDKEFQYSPSGDRLKNAHKKTRTTKMLASSDPYLEVLSSSGETYQTGDAFDVSVNPSGVKMPPLDKETISKQIAFEKSKKYESHLSSKSVLKDYVSPLGGLNVFSSSSSSSTKGTTFEGDLYAILCPYDLNGKCQDSDCVFKHQHQ